LILIDSYGWIEYFAMGPRAKRYSSYVESAKKQNTVTPTIVVFEVYRKLKRERGEQKALEAYVQMSETNIIPLDDRISLLAADASITRGLSMADAIIFATAKEYNAKIITSDSHFEGVPNVELIR
jgi:predicted nucleic acid-binding protein